MSGKSLWVVMGFTKWPTLAYVVSVHLLKTNGGTVFLLPFLVLFSYYKITLHNSVCACLWLWSCGLSVDSAGAPSVCVCLLCVHGLFWTVFVWALSRGCVYEFLCQGYFVPLRVCVFVLTNRLCLCVSYIVVLLTDDQ